MKNKEISLLANLLIEVQRSTSENLPIGHSFIPYYILITVLQHFTNEDELTVKNLFNSGAYSEMGNRYHFKRLIERNWIHLQTHPDDSRLRLILPSEKLLKAFEKISTEIQTELLNFGKKREQPTASPKTRTNLENNSP